MGNYGATDLGEKLHNLRTENEITLVELSKLSGVLASTLSDIERGKIKNPAFSTIEKISLALKVSPLYFCEDLPQTMRESEKIAILFPEDEKEILLNNKNIIPYLGIVFKAYKRGIPAETLNSIIDGVLKMKDEVK